MTKPCKNCWVKESTKDDFCASCHLVFVKAQEEEQCSRLKYSKTWSAYEKFLKTQDSGDKKAWHDLNRTEKANLDV